jgi:hypothetical protein
MFIQDPDFYPSRIPDPGSRIPDPKTATKERGEKKLVVIPFIVAIIFTKLKIILFFKCRRKKFGPIFNIIESRIRKKPNANPGSRIQGSKRHRIPDLGSGSATLGRGIPHPPSTPFYRMFLDSYL